MLIEKVVDGCLALRIRLIVRVGHLRDILSAAILINLLMNLVLRLERQVYTGEQVVVVVPRMGGCGTEESQLTGDLAHPPPVNHLTINKIQATKLRHGRPEQPSVHPLVYMDENVVAGIVEQTHKGAEKLRLVVRNNKYANLIQGQTYRNIATNPTPPHSKKGRTRRASPKITTRGRFSPKMSL